MLIPGGDPRSILLPHNLVREALQRQAAAGALMAGICAGNLVLDGRILTAQPWDYRRYAATVARELGVLDADAAVALESYPQRRAYTPRGLSS